MTRTPPLLVTGAPRSGTTWLARLLAAGRRSALAGREPMNPRGRQYALAHTLPGWARLESPSDRQARALRTAYRGLNPHTYSRYGYRQWAAPLPGVRLVVKDPFAMLSIPTVQRVTGATTVLLFRHPGATLVSYRRMGWRPNVAELTPIVHAFTERYGPAPGVVAPSPTNDETAAMAWFWNAVYGIALHDARQLGDVLVLSHQDVALGGADFCRTVFAQLGLRWHDRVTQQLDPSGGGPARADQKALHNFDRSPAQVNREWESKITSTERAQLEIETAEVHAGLLDLALRPS
ncbi:MAG TPA: sulfotransferase [Actinomycetaceae bacterium]|nr:sulfotransferase [Actinomycetaceae bacterium]